MLRAALLAVIPATPDANTIIRTGGDLLSEAVSRKLEISRSPA
jgi:hypothetical protein